MHWSDYPILSINKEDKIYPSSLLFLKDPPSALFYRGELENLDLENCLAVVGSRRMTRYGASIVDLFVNAFVLNGVTTISGYMYGVDTEVHRKTIEYGGKTVAVMGGGINQPYPPYNDDTYTKILQNGGVVLSEYKPDAKPKLWMYPQRNRVVAALATLGVLVIEAGESSGSLITVNFAKRLKKKIFAVPGPITSSVSVGTNYLIKEGIAKIVTSPEDIIKINHKKQKRDESKDLAGLEKDIYDCLKNEEMNVDEVAAATGMDLVEVSTMLSMMTLRGIVSEAGGRYFVV